MHVADALISPTVAVTAGLVSGAIYIVAARKIKKETVSENIVPLMGVMGAFIFAAQMINFTIPGTGSSGHIVGGILLCVVLGPWAAFITLSSVLVVQCLLFADGGLMALGCNIFNMGFWTCLVAYPLLYNKLIHYPASTGRILWVSVLTCVVGLFLGAVSVTVETEASGITALPIGKFLLFMIPIHLLIGVGEGIATAVVVGFIQKYRPDLLLPNQEFMAEKKKPKSGKVLVVVAVVALILGASFSWIASSYPDGLEWSISKMLNGNELENGTSQLHTLTQNVVESTALIPDYNLTISGIVGVLLMVLVTWGVTGLIHFRKAVAKKG
jgi:ABC-type Co2+ transport system, permease component